MSSPTTTEQIEPRKLIQNLVCLFHSSFHPTKGNVVDWSVKASDDLTLDGVEFSVLPSGLHLVEKDVIYFTHGSYTGIALFRRRPTRSVGNRGFRLSAFGILLSGYEKRPRPWLHLPDLQDLVDKLYKSADNKQLFSEDEERDINGIANVDLEIARVWFEERKVREKASSLAYDVGAWRGWSDELDGHFASPHTPTHHLSHFMRLLSISSLTLYKHVLARRRILILTLPPVEPACIFAWVAADMCRDYHGRTHIQNDDDPERILEDGPRVLGMITLSDIDRLESEGRKGTGWIACTTDSIFLDKPSNYDLLIDFTASVSSTASAAPSTLDKHNTRAAHSRPTLYLSKRVQQPANGNGVATSAKKTGKQKFKLDVVRFTWSDVKLWTELDRILKLDSTHNHPHSHFSQSPNVAASKWSDPLRLSEDVCVLCATFWINSGLNIGANTNTNTDTWKPSRTSLNEEDWSGSEEREGAKMRNLGLGIEGRKVSEGRKERSADGSLKVRNLGLGIEGRSGKSKGKGLVDTPPNPTNQPSISSTKGKLPGGFTDEVPSFQSSDDQVADDDESENGDDEDRLQKLHIRTTLALLQTFHAHTSFVVSQLREIISQASCSNPTSGQLSRTSTVGKGKGNQQQPNQSLLDFDDANTVNGDERDADTIVLTSKDLLALDLGIMSDLDARFVEWLAVAEELAVAEGANTNNISSEYNIRQKRKVIVKRNWRDVVGVLLGLN